MQILISKDPELKNKRRDWSNQVWSPSWIEDPAWDRESSHVAAFRRVFTLGAKAALVFHISADQRYTLYLDGKRLGFGPERGEDNNWFYQTYKETLAKGEHRLVAVVWWASFAQGLSHLAHVQHRPSLLVAGEGAKAEELLTTGIADWEVLPIAGVSFTPPGKNPDIHEYIAVGGRTCVDAAKYPAGIEVGADAAGAWKPAASGQKSGIRAYNANCFIREKQLRHGILPPMYEKWISAGKVRHAQTFAPGADTEAALFNAAAGDPALAKSFQKTLDGKAGGAPFAIPARAKMRILVDVENYVCAWTSLTVSGGKGASVKIQWAESLFNEGSSKDKGDRSEIEGKWFLGMGDTLLCGGAAGFVFEPLWWEAGRYIRLTIETAAEPLRIDALRLRETHYPHKFESDFASDDPRWGNLMKISKRVLEMCSHETYMDCPYYEQLMYVGDTRLEALATYATTRDSRLPRKAALIFDESRDPTGLTAARAPSIERQVIPPFSLWWVMMIHDNAYWRDDLAFTRARMPGVRAVLDAFRACVHSDDGLLHAPVGWNFMDWAPQWNGGVPPEAHFGACASMNLQFALVLRAAAELEDIFGEKELAARNRRDAAAIQAAATAAFWDDKRGLFAENKHFDQYSEHAQCMAILGGSVPKGKNRAIAEALFAAPDLIRCTIYFSFYLFEVCRLLGKSDELYARLPLWFEHEEKGLFTTIETPEPTRSDCHAWGAHPMFHAYATLAGIRPTAPGFKEVAITPQLGPLNKITAKMVHPAGGFIEFEAEKTPDGKLHGAATIPAGISATLTLPGVKKPLRWTGGKQEF